MRGVRKCQNGVVRIVRLRIGLNFIHSCQIIDVAMEFSARPIKFSICIRHYQYNAKRKRFKFHEKKPLLTSVTKRSISIWRYWSNLYFAFPLIYDELTSPVTSKNCHHFERINNKCHFHAKDVISANVNTYQHGYTWIMVVSRIFTGWCTIRQFKAIKI